MGCDIHFYVETRQPDGSWKTADRWGHGPYDDENETSRLDAYYEGRSYDLFSILAGVRNGSGFAGVKTGEGFVPMSEPRGVPDDACPEYKGEVEKWGVDGHSHSWCTVEELLGYDWTQTTTKQGWVGIQDWALWYVRRKSPWDQQGPDAWSGDISGGRIQHMIPEDFERSMKRLNLNPTTLLWDNEEGKAARAQMQKDLAGSLKPICCVSWDTPYYAAARNFWWQTMPRLLRLGAAQDVRCTFFFDN